MKFKKGALVYYRHPNGLLDKEIGIVVRDDGIHRTVIHFPNAVSFKRRYLLNENLELASK
jgi:hypothetical protein